MEGCPPQADQAAQDDELSLHTNRAVWAVTQMERKTACPPKVVWQVEVEACNPEWQQQAIRRGPAPRLPGQAKGDSGLHTTAHLAGLESCLHTTKPRQAERADYTPENPWQAMHPAHSAGEEDNQCSRAPSSGGDEGN